MINVLSSETIFWWRLSWRPNYRAVVYKNRLDEEPVRLFCGLFLEYTHELQKNAKIDYQYVEWRLVFVCTSMHGLKVTQELNNLESSGKQDQVKEYIFEISTFYILFIILMNQMICRRMSVCQSGNESFTYKIVELYL